MKANMEIREALEEARMMQWQLADLLGVSEQTVIKRLRHELPEDQKKELLEIIYQGECVGRDAYSLIFPDSHVTYNRKTQIAN